MTYIVGIDGGGTKTAVSIAVVNESTKALQTTASFEIVKQFSVGAINVNGGDQAAIIQSFQSIFSEIKEECNSLDKVSHICIGAAGISNPEVRFFLEQQVRSNGYQGQISITGDHETALYGAQKAMSGIILIAGTGSICLGVNEQGQQHRTGGFGHLIDDEGSGYSIGRDLLSVLVQVEDGRIADSVIPSLVYNRLQMSNVKEVIGYVYNKETTKKDIAMLAPILNVACDSGDQAALAIAERCGEQLLKLLVPVIERLDMHEANIAIAGSVLQKSQYVRSALERKLEVKFPNTKLILPLEDAAYGALLIAASKLETVSEKK